MDLCIFTSFEFVPPSLVSEFIFCFITLLPGVSLVSMSSLHLCGIILAPTYLVSASLTVFSLLPLFLDVFVFFFLDPDIYFIYASLMQIKNKARYCEMIC